MKKHVFSFIGTFLIYYFITSLFNHEWKSNVVTAFVFAVVFELFSVLFDIWQNKRKGSK